MASSTNGEQGKSFVLKAKIEEVDNAKQDEIEVAKENRSTNGEQAKSFVLKAKIEVDNAKQDEIEEVEKENHSTNGQQGKSFDLRAKIEEVDNAKQDEMVAKIRKVPKHIGENEEFHQYWSPPAATQVRTKYFTPKMLSIGPIHHHLRLGEKYKLRWTAKYVQRGNISTAELYRKIEQSIQDLKKLFEEDVIRVYGDQELAWMLFMDGCSVLYFMMSCGRDNPGELEIKYDQTVHMRTDLILLENQLPYKVLLLLSLSDSSLQNIIASYFERIADQPQRQNTDSDLRQNASNQHAIIELNEPQPTHLLHFLRQIIIKRYIWCDCVVKPETINNNAALKGLRPTYKSIRDLKAAGIGVKKAKGCRDIHYSPGMIFGNLVIPEFTADDSTAITILNVIAYEMCPDFKNGYEVSSFVEFLESVIDDAEDVRHLRKAGVLVNMLGSDQEVAQLFNGFSSDLVVSNKYKPVRMQIELQYKRKVRTWIAQFISDHFKSPWTVLAFEAAALALLLSAIQTYFSFFARKSQG